MALFALPLLGGLVPLTGCKGGSRSSQRAQAATAYEQADQAHQRRFAEFEVKYSRIEQRLRILRPKAPAEVVQVIQREMMPLLTEMAQSIDPLCARGEAYVRLLDESVKAKAELRKSLAIFREQQRAVRAIRRTYVDEATLFGQGRPRSEDLQEIFDRRLDAAKRMERKPRVGRRRRPAKGSP